MKETHRNYSNCITHVIPRAHQSLVIEPAPRNRLAYHTDGMNTNDRGSSWVGPAVVAVTGNNSNTSTGTSLSFVHAGAALVALDDQPRRV